MAQPKKKGVTVPKPTTVSMRKYNELKAKYEALKDVKDSVAKANASLAEENKSITNAYEGLLKEFTNYKNKANEPKNMCATPGPIENQEFIVLDKMVNLIKQLNPFQRRTVVAGFLSSIKERTKAEAVDLYRQKSNIEAEAAYRTETWQQHCESMQEMSQVIDSFK